MAIYSPEKSFSRLQGLKFQMQCVYETTVLVIVKTAATEDLKSLALNKRSRSQCPPVQIASYFLLLFLNGIWLHNVIHYLPLNCLQLPFYWKYQSSHLTS